MENDKGQIVDLYIPRKWCVFLELPERRAGGPGRKRARRRRPPSAGLDSNGAGRGAGTDMEAGFREPETGLFDAMGRGFGGLFGLSWNCLFGGLAVWPSRLAAGLRRWLCEFMLIDVA